MTLWRIMGLSEGDIPSFLTRGSRFWDVGLSKILGVPLQGAIGLI